VSLPLDVYRARGAGSHPAVLVIHGGEWRYGDKESWAPEALRLARAGFVAFVIDYRMACPGTANTLCGANPLPCAAPTCGFHYPDEVSDARSALRWVRRHARAYGADPRRIAALGGDAGGQLALLLATTGGGQAGRLKAVVSWSGPTDLVAIAASPNVMNYIGCSYQTCPGRYLDASPADHVSHGDPPTYLANSDHELVPLSQATSFAQKLRRARVPVRLRVVSGFLHGSAYLDAVWHDTVRFLRRYLRSR
jgi:acetyl esterase/lipase